VGIKSSLLLLSSLALVACETTVPTLQSGPNAEVLTPMDIESNTL